MGLEPELKMVVPKCLINPPLLSEVHFLSIRIGFLKYFLTVLSKVFQRAITTAS